MADKFSGASETTLRDELEQPVPSINSIMRFSNYSGPTEYAED